MKEEIKKSKKALRDCSYKEVESYCKCIFNSYGAHAVFAAYELLYRLDDEEGDAAQELHWEEAMRDALPRFFKKSVLSEMIEVNEDGDA